MTRSRRLAIRADGAHHHLRLSGGRLTVAEARELELVAGDLAEPGSGIRVVVLGTQGPDFCPGPAPDLDPLTAGVDPVAALARLTTPVIAALRGEVGSVGLELALACDLRIAQHDTVLSMRDVSTGRLPCWGGTQRLPRLAGRSVASLMLLAGEELDAQAALKCGLVHAVEDDADAATGELAGRLAELAPLALAAAKEALAKGPELPMRHALELEGDLNHLLQTTSDRAEGLAAFFEKRPPSFDGR